MPSRFFQRLGRQTEAMKSVWPEARQYDAPPYQYEAWPEVQRPRSFMSDTIQQSPPPPYSQSLHSRYLPPKHLELPQDTLILVTGACGWQGIHVADQLLGLGYRVRGAIQDSNDASWVSKHFEQKYGNGRFSPVLVPDFAVRSAYNSAVEGCSGVIHCASVTSWSSDPTAVITPSIAGALNVLEAAHREPLVKRVVYCSSIAAAASSWETRRQEITSDSWNISDLVPAWQAPPYTPDNAQTVYAASKLQTEQMVWRWYQDKRPHFTLNAVLPAFLFGRQLAPKSQGPRSSVGLLRSLWDGDVSVVSRFAPNHFVDVQDSALIHVAALILPDVRHQRIFATNSPFDWNNILVILRKLFPFRPFPSNVESSVTGTTIFREAIRGEELLQRLGKKGYTDLQTSLQRCCEGFCT